MQRPTRFKLIALDADANTLRAIAETVGTLYDTIRLRDGQAALTVCDEDPLVRVVVAEHMIHPPTGHSVLEVMRLRHPLVRRVMLTTYADLRVIVNGLHTGAIQYLAHKPIQRGELLAAVGTPGTAPLPDPSAANGMTPLSA